MADFTHLLIYYYGNWRTSYYITCITLLLYRAGWRAEPSQDIIIYRWLQFTGSPKMNQGFLTGFVWTQIKKMIPAFNCNLSSMMLSPELSLEQQWMKVLVVWWWDWGGLGSHPGSSVSKSSWHLFWLPQRALHLVRDTQRPERCPLSRTQPASVRPASLIPWKENSHAVQPPGTFKELQDCSRNGREMAKSGGISQGDEALAAILTVRIKLL